MNLSSVLSVLSWGPWVEDARVEENNGAENHESIWHGYKTIQRYAIRLFNNTSQYIGESITWTACAWNNSNEHVNRFLGTKIFDLIKPAIAKAKTSIYNLGSRVLLFFNSNA